MTGNKTVSFITCIADALLGFSVVGSVLRATGAFTVYFVVFYSTDAAAAK